MTDGRDVLTDLEPEVILIDKGVGSIYTHGQSPRFSVLTPVSGHTGVRPGGGRLGGGVSAGLPWWFCVPRWMRGDAGDIGTRAACPGEHPVCGGLAKVLPRKIPLCDALKKGKEVPGPWLRGVC